MYVRRLKIFMGVIAAVMLVVIVRLAQLQILHGAKYRERAEKSLRSVELLPCRRGTVHDRHGRILAVNKQCYEFCLDYRFLTSDATWVNREKRRLAAREDLSQRKADEVYARRARNTWEIAAEFGGVTREELSEAARRIIARVRAILRYLRERRRSAGAGVAEVASLEIREQHQSHPVIRGLSEESAAAIKARLNEMIGASVRPGYIRYYPYEATACHVIGTTREVSAEEQKRLNLAADEADWIDRARVNYLDGDVIGANGIELACETALRGRRGYRTLKRAGKTHEVTEEHSGTPGGSVRLSLDIELQRRLTDLFVRTTSAKNAADGARVGHAPSNGAIVVLSLPEREVLALVSVPTYDLNGYRELLAELGEAPRGQPLLNRPVQVRYPIGSTAKPVAALAGLSTTRPGKGITRGTQFTCNGRIQVGRAKYLHCWTEWRGMAGHGPVNVVEAIKHSCNIFFYSVGGRLGLEELSRWFVEFGFADVVGLGLPEEQPGIVPTQQWLAEKKPGYRPVPIDAMQVAIGQGFLGATPAHVANAMATIACGGRFRRPLLVVDPASPPAPERDLGIAAADVQAVVEGMYKVVNESGGTAYRRFREGAPPITGVTVHGKTGTATATPTDLDHDGVIDAYERNRNEMGWFAGFAVPKGGAAGRPGTRGIAFAVVVEYVTGGGGRNAAPIAREAIRTCRELGYIE